MEISKQIIFNTFEVDKLKEMKKQIDNKELLKIIDKKIKYNRWELVWVNLGTPESNLKEDNYNKSQIINDLKGINIGVEFSLIHPAIIVSPYFLNKEKVIIIPITSFENHNCKYNNLYCLKNYELLTHQSVMLIDQIKTVSTKRIVRHKKRLNQKEVIIYINKQDQQKIIKKISNILFGFEI